jgi:hypothetical protein
MTCLGVARESGSTLANHPVSSLHLRSVTLSVHDGTTSLPSKGTFDWHYMQCVIKVFGTSEYKNHPDIKFFIHPFKTDSDDSDSEYPDDQTEPPYPSYWFDQRLAELGRRQIVRERDEKVAQWSLNVPSGSGI